MGRVSHPDQDRIERLHRMLEAAGVDVKRVGDDLTMPSPFKERKKGKKDDKRRLSVTVAAKDGEPAIFWQCWFSKRPDGTNFGGLSAYALSIVLKQSQGSILQALDMRFDAETAAAEELADQMALIINQDKREQARRTTQQAVVVAPPRPHLPPKAVTPLFAGSGLTWRGEELIQTRAISPEVARHYGLGWDFDQQAVVMPWCDREGRHVYHQWWNPDWPGRAYRFPYREDGVVSKTDAIFGINRWSPRQPLILCEGPFDAMTVGGCHLGGSTLTDAQTALLMSLSPCPGLVVLAFDKDTAGIQGAKAISQTLRMRMPESKVVTVYAPTKDWNDLAMLEGAKPALDRFVSAVREAMTGDNLLSMMQQIIS